MTPESIILLIAVILTLVPVWILVFRRPKGLSSDEAARLIDERLRPLSDELAKTRESLERTVREEGLTRDKQLRDETRQIRETLDTRLDALKSSFAELDKQLLTSFKAQSEALHKSFSDARDHQAGELRKARGSQDERLDKVEERLGKLTTEILESMKTQAEANHNAVLTLQERVAKELTELRKTQQEATAKLGEQVGQSLEATRKASEEKLEKIRLTVDEKLHETLEKRLGESFKLVSERLELVQKGLGEMQALASDVGGLKRVLTNVRSRGSFGEVQLESLLEQVFTPQQYEKNCVTVPGSNERVEFALLLPGRDGDDQPVRLPIDAKFPVEARERLEQAIEDNDKEAYTAAQKELGRLLLAEAAKIRNKYVAPPHTTDFALMFIPTEGLYAELLRIPGCAEAMHADQHVIPVGPMNLFAILNSLQMGFRTLAIEKRSAEVWKILGAVKGEFEKFGESLAAVSKKLTEAQNKIAFSERRSRVLTRKLKDVEDLPEGDPGALLDDVVQESAAGQLPLDDEDEA